MTLRVAIVEDDKEIRDELAGQVSRMKACELDFSIGSYQELVQIDRQKEYNPDVILLDLFLGKGKQGGIAVLDYLHSRKKHPKIIVISSYCDENHLNETELKGAHAHVKKSLTAGANPGFLENIIQKVCDTRHPIGFWAVVSHSNVPVSQQTDIKLSPLQKDLLNQLINGKTQVQIAQERKEANQGKGSVSTINNIFAQLRKKCKVSTNAELIRKAIEMRLCM